ncbi:oxidoreductase tpcG [Aspergillus homomorphus CBS 101889]|uniref:Putative NAD-dependent epimerase/dehydratase n=1 Tax=Aspergillus homomorphus (strain CBS 101889) TaxID=1450537 RepID=A0A395HWV0_ASPHC|nr:putative NAD-dependent epimerase/dehydratase [Aspergillus homomorphus CBS 101889]RAL12381.1 putative NAD-dependent epimerase/dehydratase [Aspergillus homomorphus CBS 101889]
MAYAVLGATGNCGTALIQTLLGTSSTNQVHAYCRNKPKLQQQLPELVADPRVTIFEGSIHEVALMTACIRGCHAVFLAVSTNDNVPQCRMGTEAATTVLQALRILHTEQAALPKLVLLSSATLDDQLSQNTAPWVRWILLRSASHVYADLRRVETLLRAQQDWGVTTIFIKPGGLSVDEVRRGHRLSLTEEKSPLSYLDLAAAMIEAADEPDGRYDMRNVGVAYAEGGPARFPRGAPLCISMGLVRHYLPFLHPYLPATGPI